MNQMPVYYISVEGNTDHFLKKMSAVFHNLALHRLTDQCDLQTITTPFFCFVPTYVKGTQQDAHHVEKQPGENFQMREVNTLTLHDELGYHQNYRKCLGIVGSGNRNFGEDSYCWTALLYHRQYHVPLVDDFELRGTAEDENRINRKMVRIWNASPETHSVISFQTHRIVNPRLAELERKYRTKE